MLNEAHETTSPTKALCPSSPGPGDRVRGLRRRADSNAVAIDTMWILLAAVLVFLMQAGLAMLETDLTRAKNAANILIKNLMDFSIGSLAFWAIGYGLMFGASKAGLFGLSHFFLDGTSATDAGSAETASTFAFWLFQEVFAATATTIVSGSMAERTRFPAYMVYSVFVTALIYPVVGSLRRLAR